MHRTRKEARWHGERLQVQPSFVPFITGTARGPNLLQTTSISLARGLFRGHRARQRKRGAALWSAPAVQGDEDDPEDAADQRGEEAQENVHRCHKDW